MRCPIASARSRRRSRKAYRREERRYARSRRRTYARFAQLRHVRGKGPRAPRRRRMRLRHQTQMPLGTR